MKFEKFVKTLASSGVIYEKGDSKERWLASPSVYMHIPFGISSVTSAGILPMHESISKMIDQMGYTVEAELTAAVLPLPDCGIRDCLRVFTSKDKTLSCNICNDDWTLIEKSDFCEILYAYDSEEEPNIPQVKALLVKHYPTTPTDDELVGIIFPDHSNI